MIFTWRQNIAWYEVNFKWSIIIKIITTFDLRKIYAYYLKLFITRKQKGQVNISILIAAHCIAFVGTPLKEPSAKIPYITLTNKHKFHKTPKRATVIININSFSPRPRPPSEMFLFRNIHQLTCSIVMVVWTRTCIAEKWIDMNSDPRELFKLNLTVNYDSCDIGFR